MKIYQSISKSKYFVLSLTSFLLFLFCWVLLSKVLPGAKVFLPSPLSVLFDLGDLFQNQNYLQDILSSILRVTIGFFLAVIVAFPLGILAGAYKVADAIIQPFNDFIRYMPVAAFVPLSILWLGIGDTQKIFIIFIGTVFQLIPLIADTASRMPKHLIELAYTMGAKPFQVVIRVVIPWCMPVIYDHFRVALGWAWSYLIIAELVAATSGIGHVIIQSQRFIQTGNVMAGILVVGILGLFFDYIFKLSRRLIFKWE